VAKSEKLPKSLLPVVLTREPETKASKLLDAGLLVFLATAISLGTSTLYIWGLSWSLRFAIQSYFGLREYLDVTAYWLGPLLGFTMLLSYQQLHNLMNIGIPHYVLTIGLLLYHLV
jgi:hypothetical protein